MEFQHFLFFREGSGSLVINDKFRRNTRKCTAITCVQYFPQMRTSDVFETEYVTFVQSIWICWFLATTADNLLALLEKNRRVRRKRKTIIRKRKCFPKHCTKQQTVAQKEHIAQRITLRIHVLTAGDFAQLPPCFDNYLFELHAEKEYKPWNGLEENAVNSTDTVYSVRNALAGGFHNWISFMENILYCNKAKRKHASLSRPRVWQDVKGATVGKAHVGRQRYFKHKIYWHVKHLIAYSSRIKLNSRAEYRTIACSLSAK